MARSRDSSLHPLLVSLAVLACSGVLALGIIFYLTPSNAPNTSTNPSTVQPATPAELKAAAADLKSTIEAMEKRLDHFEKLLAALVTVGAILGIASGAYQLFNVKELNATAEKQLAEFSDKFPPVAGLNQRIKSVLDEIRSNTNLMFDGWDQDSYNRLSPQSREVIRLNEISFSGLELFDLSKSSALVGYATEIYTAFGRFYGSSYYCDKQNESAVERSKIYLRIAIKSADMNLRERALADLGTISCWHADRLSEGDAKSAAFQEARRSFDDACALRSYNPAALIGRAWLKRRDQDLHGATNDLNDLITALTEKKLSEEEKRRYPETAYLNRACYRVIGADPHDSASVYRSALDDLWESKKAAIGEGRFERWLEDLDRELKQNGDLLSLKHKHKTELDDLRDRAKETKT
jgi:hypothetical protein